ncbi:MAG: translation initiation factor [Planctomycetes bacterium]|nr:translation initiation factor [Planctomycetota bacterium]
MMGLLSGTVFDRIPHCERCDKPEPECSCPPLPVAKAQKPPNQQTAALAVEKRKKGKIVTLVRGLSSDANDLPSLLTKLKSTCGAGGTLDGDTLEIQGEHRDRIRELLIKDGFKVKG